MDISHEKKLNYWFYGSYSILAISGLISLLWDKHNIFNQWLALIHSIVALLFVILFALITTIHFKRTLGKRKPGLTLSGIFFVAVTGYLVYSGFIISLRGQTEAGSVFINHHTIATIGSLLLLLIHIIGHLYHSNKQHDISCTLLENKSEDKTFPSIPTHITTTIIASCIVSLAASILLTIIYEQIYQQSTQNNSRVILSGSQICADCHLQIALEWRDSAHRHAASSPVYLANIASRKAENNQSENRICENCHSPIYRQIDQTNKHHKQNLSPALLEGVSCLSCHTARLPNINEPTKHIYMPYQPYLFSNNDNKVARAIHNYLLRIMPEQHMQDMGRNTLQSYAACAPCHEGQFNNRADNRNDLVFLNEYTSWLNSPFAKHKNSIDEQTQDTRCQNCHMPLLKENDPSTNTDRMYRSHRFLGANTLIPALYGNRIQSLRTKSFMQTNKIRLTIEEPNRNDATQSKKYVDENIRAITEKPAYYYLNEKGTIQVTVTNSGVGHDFPGGAKELSEVWLEINVTDATGQIIYTSGDLLENHQVDPNAYFYGLTPHSLKNSSLVKHKIIHQYDNKAMNIIPPGKSDIVSYQFVIPSWTKGPITITAVLKYRELRQEYAKWVLKEKYHKLPIIDVSRDTILVPILEQPPILH